MSIFILIQWKFLLHSSRNCSKQVTAYVKEMHDVLIGTKNQEVKLQEITVKATWGIQGGKILQTDQSTKKDSSKSISYFK